MTEQKTKRLPVNSLQSLARAVKTITQLFHEHKNLVVSVRIGKDRSLNQNALWFAMYQRISDMLGMGDVEEARRYCKLHFGVQILVNQSAEFREQWYAVMRDLPYETKLELMGACPMFASDGFPVTRLFTRPQGVEYTRRIVDYFTQQGVIFDDLLKEQD